jgi:hypothetical protein
MAASSAVDRSVGTHVSHGVECRPDWTRIQLDKTTAGDARRAEGWGVRRKPNGDGRVAPKGRTRYFLLQPSLPLIQATLVRGAFGVRAPARPVNLLLFACFLNLPLVSCLPTVYQFRQNLTNPFDIGITPRSNFNASDDLSVWRRHFLGCDISTQGRLTNPQSPSRFSR